MEAARSVPQAREPEKSVYEEWFARSPDNEVEGEPAIGWLGGGSDHIGFVCHVGVASAAFSGGGSPGTAYHTARDTLTWYRQVVGEDYEPALMIARMTNAVASRLANAPVPPMDVNRATFDVARELKALAGAYEEQAEVLGALAEALRGQIPVHDPSSLTTADVIRADRRWLAPSGIEGRDWFKNRLVATDPTNGYGAWPLPEVRAALESADSYELHRAMVGIQEGLFGKEPEVKGDE